ncbi:unnamed protein product [Symbiodinium sp. KB8]|nr:unnamed protein product [Symbiodinium sp. KB8]
MAGASGAAAAVQKIKHYVFEDEEFEGTFKTWAEANCHVVDLTLPPEEHRLEYTDLHRQFTELFNRKLDEHIEEEGVSVEDVYAHLAEIMEKSPLSEDAFLVRIMLSITDFQSFVEMMREVAEEVQSAGERKE